MLRGLSDAANRCRLERIARPQPRLNSATSVLEPLQPADRADHAIECSNFLVVPIVIHPVAAHGITWSTIGRACASRGMPDYFLLSKIIVQLLLICRLQDGAILLPVCYAVKPVWIMVVVLILIAISGIPVHFAVVPGRHHARGAAPIYPQEHRQKQVSAVFTLEIHSSPLSCCTTCPVIQDEFPSRSLQDSIRRMPSAAPPNCDADRVR